MKRSWRLIAAAIGPALLAVPASASTILSTTGSGGGDPSTSYVGFSISSAFTNVAISFTAAVNNASSGTAYLTTMIGPGTTVASQVAATTFNAAASGSISLFTGLSLASGTYYLTVGGETFSGFFWELGNAPSAGTMATVGDTYNGATAASYVPATNFDNQVMSKGQFLDVNITGTAVPSAVPEPASMALLGIGVAGVAASRRKSSQAR